VKPIFLPESDQNKKQKINFPFLCDKCDIFSMTALLVGKNRAGLSRESSQEHFILAPRKSTQKRKGHTSCKI